MIERRENFDFAGWPVHKRISIVFSGSTSKHFVTQLLQLDVAAAVASGSSAILPPVTAAAKPRSSTGVLHFHSHDANIVVKGFAFRKLADVVNDAVEKFLGWQGSVTSDSSVQLLFREDRAGSIFHLE